MDPLVNADNAADAKFQKGVRVPKDAVGLSWVTAPKLTPKDNVVVIDTTNTTPENKTSGYSKKIMHANYMGILEDEFGNQIIDDEYPIISDVFDISEENIATAGNEFTADKMFPFVHVSRYFHLDFSGLSIGTLINDYVDDIIRVVDAHGDEYLSDIGRKRYKVKIVSATQSSSEEGNISAYRLHVYVDTDTNESLYLAYNKCELDGDGAVIDQDINHKEILNPQPYYRYVPEESEVIDFVNRDERLYSTKPASKKDQLIGLNQPDIEGFNVFVPRKAIPDPRIFQLFRWRINCEFTDSYTVDPIRQPQVIRCGVLTHKNNTNTADKVNHSVASYAFYNLQRSKYNAAGVRFINPLKTGDTSDLATDSQQEFREYWEVDFKTVTHAQLAKFDVLLLAVPNAWFNLKTAGGTTNYLDKINYFTKECGGTFLVETNGYTKYEYLGIGTTSASNPVTAERVTGNLETFGVSYLKNNTNPRSVFPNYNHAIFDGLEEYGGWKFSDNQGDNEYKTISPYQVGKAFATYSGSAQTAPIVAAGHYVHRFGSNQNGFTTVLGGKSDLPGNPERPVVVSKRMTSRKGFMYASSCGAFSAVSQLFNPRNGRILNKQQNSSILRNMQSTYGFTYDTAINSQYIEGSYKLLYNICLHAVKGKQLDNSDETSFSSSWTLSTEWQPSWVIDATSAELSQEEIQENHFSRFHTAGASEDYVWKRNLSPGNTPASLINAVLATLPIKDRVKDAKRVYTIEVTNHNVICDDVLNSSAPVQAWTTAFTPSFSVPAELGPYTIKEDNITGDYQEGEYSQRSYPPKKFKGKVAAAYSYTNQIANTYHINWTAQASATETIKTGKEKGNVSRDLTWVEDSFNTTYESTRPHERGLQVPRGISTWQDENYYSSTWGSGLLNWPSFGINARLTIGSSGEYVSFLQDAINLLSIFRIFDPGTGPLTVNGRFDATTAAAVLALQDEFGAIYQNGVADTETWFILGNQILRLGGYAPSTTKGYKRFYSWPRKYMSKKNISNGEIENVFLKQSNLVGGPRIIRDFIRIQFDQAHFIHGVELTPYLPGGSKSMIISSIDVVNYPKTLEGYNPKHAKLKSLNFKTKAESVFSTSFGPYYGDTVIIGLAQDQPSKHGSMREMGVMDIKVNAKSTLGGGTVSQRTVNNVKTGKVVVTSPTTEIMRAALTKAESSHLSDITWTGLTVTLSDDMDYEVTETDALNGTISIDGESRISYSMNPSTGSMRFNTGIATTIGGGGNEIMGYSNGPTIPAASGSYTMTTAGAFIPGKNTGWLSKNEGVVLFCDSKKRPIGFPTIDTFEEEPVSGKPGSEEQLHYTILTVVADEADPSIKYGLYDLAQKEFIFNGQGSPSISYIEYKLRGPQNIFIAAISEYSEELKKPLPVASNAPAIPYKWAMPIYGICVQSGSQICVEQPRTNLGPTDMWTLPVRTGKFNRVVNIPSRNDKPYSGFLARYQNKSVKAFYSVPEAKKLNWSDLFGRPYIDIGPEVPTIEDASTIRIANSPILMAKRPTADEDDADPVVPQFLVFTRPTVTDEFELVEWSDIKDYNASTGEITLNFELESSDPNLIAVYYTTSLSRFPYAGSSSDMLFLNPYLPFTKENIGKPIYICLYPEFVRDIKDNNKLITDSVRDRALFWTTDPASFSDPLSPNYDPLIVELAVVYVTNAVDINDISLIDIRKRGGGLIEPLALESTENFNAEFKNYWDINYAYGEPYQAGGFVIIRLPASLKERFPEYSDIEAVIERNIPAGVRYKVEDLQGNDWN